MNVRDLINELQNYDEDAEVRLAFQPSWPFEHSIDTVAGVSSDPLDSGYEALRDDDGWYVEAGGEQLDGPFETEEEALAACRTHAEEEAKDHGNVVWLAEGRQIGYLPGAACKALGW
jgi:hypothetical protein